jgi:hypothetical protein
MEWVKVIYPGTRDVFVDERRVGQTNVVLAVPQGSHRFHLGVPSDYAPRRRTLEVVGTSPLVPQELAFGPDGRAPTRTSHGRR